MIKAKSRILTWTNWTTSSNLQAAAGGIVAVKRCNRTHKLHLRRSKDQWGLCTLFVQTCECVCFEIITGRTCFSKQWRADQSFPFVSPRFSFPRGQAAGEGPGEGSLVWTAAKTDSMWAYLHITEQPQNLEKSS